ncbi:MAG: universal stress protein [Gemmataceae bacterium]
MFKKILLPLDLSDRHGAVLKAAVELARQSGGSIELFHVIETLAGLSIEEERDFYARLEKAARKHLDKQGRLLSDAGVAWMATVRLGHRGAEIVKHAGESAADLIVLTAPRLDPGGPEGWGSLSYKVSILSPCPVLLVK